jgi:metallophosphoesterase (TIGR00282 family)
VRILFFGDIVGKNGREAIKKYLNELKNKYRADFIIANGENASHGKGLLENHYLALLNYGINAITLGNHYQNKDSIKNYISRADKLIRPLNILNNFEGSGSRLFYVNGIAIRITNLLGQAFMNEDVVQPYLAIKPYLNQEDSIHIVDFHAEATSEKEALGYLLDGKVSAVIGTHTHVQTNDARILSGGTAYISDVGMCGARNGILGFEKNSVMKRTIFNEKSTFQIDDNDCSIISAIFLEIDDNSKKAIKVEIINVEEKVK